MSNLAGVVQQIIKERDQAATVVDQLDAALAALNGRLYGKRTRTRRKMSAAATGEDRGCPKSTVGKGPWE
jgi:predicted site-specific integrase-resolvase